MVASIMFEGVEEVGTVGSIEQNSISTNRTRILRLRVSFLTHNVYWDKII